MYSSHVKTISVTKENGSFINQATSPKNGSVTNKNHNTNIKNQNQCQRLHKSNIIQSTNSRKKGNNSIFSNNNHNSHSSSNRKKFQNNNITKNQNICPNKDTRHSILNSTKYIESDYLSNGTNLYCKNSIKLSSPIRIKYKLKTNNNIDINSYKNNCSSNSNNIKSPLKVSMVMNSTPNITDQNTVTVTATKSTTTITSTPVPSASYSLDFLHSVGVQMTIGGSNCSNSRIYTPTSPPPLPTRKSYMNRYSSAALDDINLPFVESQNLSKDFNNYGSHFSPSSKIRSKNTSQILIANETSFSPQQLYPNNDCSQHLHHQYHYYHSQQHYVQYQNIISGHHFNNNNRDHQNHQFKNTSNTNPQSIMQKTNKAVNNYGSSLTVDGREVHTPSQSISRFRTTQNYSNLKYVTTDNSIVVGSRSSTPSPSSESQLNFKTQHLKKNQTDNTVPIINSMENNDVLEKQSSVSLLTKSEPSPNVIQITEAKNEYESESSCQSNEKCFLVNKNINKPIIGPNKYQVGEINPLICFPPQFSEQDVFKTQGNYYGSHQNLTYWNVGLNPSFRAYGFYSPNSIWPDGSSEISSQYINETGTLVTSIKRVNSTQKRTLRGRRHLYSSFRAHSFHENVYTPPDKFLARAHLVEVKETPENILNGTKWDTLTKDIWKKFITSQQTEETYKKKMYLWRYLYVTIKKTYPRYGLYLVGSTISGFGADTSDVDMCLVSRNACSIDPRMEALFNLTLLRDYLGTLGVFEHFNLIEAKVPILRFRDSMHMLEVDLNFNNCVGIRNTHLLHCYSQLDWRLRPLVLITKLWAQFHNINNAKNMTISSYSLVLMVIHFLQVAVNPPILPCLHHLFPEKFQIILKSNDFGFVDMNEDIGQYESQNTQTLGELFLQYLEYYSNFDYARFAISVRTGSILPIEICRQAKSPKNDVHQWKELCIEEPFDLTNTARSVYDFETFERVKSIFIYSWKILNETMDLNSIFIPNVPVSVTKPIP